jgi:hypothetical protein
VQEPAIDNFVTESETSISFLKVAVCREVERQWDGVLALVKVGDVKDEG